MWKGQYGSLSLLQWTSDKPVYNERITHCVCACVCQKKCSVAGQATSTHECLSMQSDGVDACSEKDSVLYNDQTCTETLYRVCSVAECACHPSEELHTCHQGTSLLTQDVRQMKVTAKLHQRLFICSVSFSAVTSWLYKFEHLPWHLVFHTQFFLNSVTPVISQKDLWGFLIHSYVL